MDSAVERKHIPFIYGPNLLKRLYANALSIDIDDNNIKVDIIMKLLGSDRFYELGPGTNRFAVVGPDDLCHKIALDRRGIVDNLTEFKRAPDIAWCTPKVYETNGLIDVCERVELITPDDFRNSRGVILDICKELSKTYIFEDIGYAPRNFCNWGIRPYSDELVILDTGYMIPRAGNEDAMTCPVCGAPLDYNSTYTGFICHDSRCNTKFSFIDVYRRLDHGFDDAIYGALTGFNAPDLDNIATSIYNTGIMRGGHIEYDGGPTERELEDDEPSDEERYGGPSGTVRVEDLVNILAYHESERNL